MTDGNIEFFLNRANSIQEAIHELEEAIGAVSKLILEKFNRFFFSKG